jgi:hypothetical protein
MAELIPFEYRVRITRQRYVRRWTLATVVAAIAAGVALANVYAWQQRQVQEYARLDREYKDKSVLIKQAMELQGKRLDLAARMQKMQSLRDDKTLLSLLKSVSAQFTEKDSLQYLNILAHANQRNSPARTDGGGYSVQLVGVTSDYTSHANLLDRLTDAGHKSEPPLNLPPGSTRIEKVFEGEVVHFEIVGEAPKTKGN